MNFNEIITGGGGMVLVLLTLIQIAPIRLNPWTKLARFIGKAINGEVISKVDTLSGNVQDLKDKFARNDALNMRARILRFGDEVLHDQKHTKEHFDQVIRDIQAYENYCGKYPDFENGVTCLTNKRIKEIYKERLEKNDFL